MRVTFKLKPRETGLRAIGAGPRGYDIKLDGKEVGSIYPIGGAAFNGPHRGWYYVVAADGFTYRNTCGEINVPIEDIKVAAKKYVLEQARARAGLSVSDPKGGDRG